MLFRSIHVEKPIYPSKNKKRNENVEILMQKNYEVWKDIYEDTYKIPLKYTCEEK